MIIKSFEANKININKNNIILMYGKNEGFKRQLTDKISSKFNEIETYEEKEVLDYSNNFLENILNKSLFSEEQIFIIKRATDKILKIIEEVNLKEISDTIIIHSDNLDKKSKLRSFFEKDKKLICIPFYPDNDQTLSKIAYEFFKKRNIPISQSNINQIILKCYGDRENLFSELKKIEHFVSRKAMNIDSIGKKQIKKLYDEGLIQNISDLYQLKKGDLINLRGFEETSIEKLLIAIESSKKIKFEKVFGTAIIKKTTVKKKFFKNILVFS